MENNRNKAIRKCEQYFKEQGFIKSGANLYRVYGEDLLQVITARGFSERVNNTTYRREVASYFAVFSLYSSIFWVPIKMIPRRDLIPNISPCLVNPDRVMSEFQGTIAECEELEKSVLPYLNNMTTHTQMVELFDLIDSSIGREKTALDSARVVPYLLAERKGKAIETISAIERQNREAFEANCRRIDGYDAEKQREIINLKLAPLIALREATLRQDVTSISHILQRNFFCNVEKLRKLGISVTSSFNVEEKLLGILKKE